MAPDTPKPRLPPTVDQTDALIKKLISRLTDSIATFIGEEKLADPFDIIEVALAYHQAQLKRAAALQHADAVAEIFAAQSPATQKRDDSEQHMYG
jgi:hypothetical protein